MRNPAPPAEHHLRAFGLNLKLAGSLPPGAWQERPASEPARCEPAIELRRATAEEIAEHWSGRAELGWEAKIDGAPFVAEVGRDGDQRFLHGNPGADHDVHHLSRDGRVLRCAPACPQDPRWWRIVLDSVLFTVALLKGHQALHAAAVVTPAGAVAITAPSGGGKSTLLGELLRGGLPLLADDIVALEPQPGTRPIAHPAPPLMTVPAAIAAGRGAEGLGEPVAPVGAERWIAVPVHAEAVPLAAIVLLDRRRGAESAVEPMPRIMGTLVTSLLRYPLTSERERTRFEFASELSACVPLMRLTADPTVSPHDLAELLARHQDLPIDCTSKCQPTEDPASSEP